MRDPLYFAASLACRLNQVSASRASVVVKMPRRAPAPSTTVVSFSLRSWIRLWILGPRFLHGNDREGRERLCRYALRPPLALQRLTHVSITIPVDVLVRLEEGARPRLEL